MEKSTNNYYFLTPNSKEQYLYNSKWCAFLSPKAIIGYNDETDNNTLLILKRKREI